MKVSKVWVNSVENDMISSVASCLSQQTAVKATCELKSVTGGDEGKFVPR
jgi:hypothetical protein